MSIADAASLDAFTLADPPPGFIDDPYPFYARLREHDPVHAIGPQQWLLTRYDDVSPVYRSAARQLRQAARVRPEVRRRHAAARAPHHQPRVQRPAAAHARAPSDDGRAEPACDRAHGSRRRGAGRTACSIACTAAPQADLIEDFAAQIPVEVIGNLLDVPRDERGPLRAWSLAILSALEPVPSADVLARGNAAVSDFLAYLRTLVAERRRHPGDPEVDVLTRLIRASTTASGSRETELLHNCIFLLNAGHETTTNLIGNGMHALLTQRSQLERLQREPRADQHRRGRAAALRKPAAAQQPPARRRRSRSATRELPAGDFVTLGVGAANRDPAQFTEPDRLDIARKPNRHVAFGHGAHACAGMNVARLEARIAIGALVARFPRLDAAARAAARPARALPRLRAPAGAARLAPRRSIRVGCLTSSIW